MTILPSQIKKIAVFRALYLGDLLCAIPALRALRQRFPQAEIDLIGLPWASVFVERFPEYLDGFFAFPGCPGLPEQISDPPSLIAFLNRIRAQKFDLVLQMQGDGTIVNRLIQSFGSTYYAGFYKDNYSGKTPSLFLKYPEGISEIKRHMALMAHLGILNDNLDLEFPFQERDTRDLNELPLHFRPKKYVILHPGSRNAARRWAPVYFAMLGDLVFTQGFTVFISGTSDESDIASEVLKNMRNPALDLTGKTTLGAMGLLLKDAFLLITNCTGVSHMAAALHTPSIVISMDGEPIRWGPLNKERHHVFDCHRYHRFAEIFTFLYSQLQK